MYIFDLLYVYYIYRQFRTMFKIWENWEIEYKLQEGCLQIFYLDRDTVSNMQ